MRFAPCLLVIIGSIAGCSTSPVFPENTNSARPLQSGLPIRAIASPTSLLPIQPVERANVADSGLQGTSLPISALKVAPSAQLAKLIIKSETPAKKTWEVRATDATIYGALKRWSKDAGMQLMWETENHDLRLRGQASYLGDFDTAVAELMKSVEGSDYPMRACIYDNGAIRVIHIKKPCKG